MCEYRLRIVGIEWGKRSVKYQRKITTQTAHTRYTMVVSVLYVRHVCFVCIGQALYT